MKIDNLSKTVEEILTTEGKSRDMDHYQTILRVARALDGIDDTVNGAVQQFMKGGGDKFERERRAPVLKVLKSLQKDLNNNYSRLVNAGVKYQRDE